MTTRLTVGAISADANRLASNLVHYLLRDARPSSDAASAWPSRASQGAAKISLLGFTRMLSSAAEQSGRNLLGLEMAGADQAGRHTIFGGLFQYAPTVGDALEAMARYFPAGQTGTRVDLVHANGSSRLIYDICDPAVGDRLQDAAYTLGKVCRSLRRVVGDSWVLDHVTLAASAPGSQESYRNFFQAPVVFGATNTSLCFSSHLLDMPIRSADPQRYADFCQHLERLMPGSNEPDLLADALRAWTSHAVRHGNASLEQAASDFGLTPRTLQRRLKEQGISFQEILAQVRMDAAQHMLTASRLPVTRIAEQLGFSETSAFTRAFRGYTQQSPRAFRQAALSAS